MDNKEFFVEIDGRKVLIDQEQQQVTILDEDGAVVFRDHIQVAAASKQDLFSALDSATIPGLGFNPTKTA